jgi:phosphoglycolate phosphatase
MRGRRSRGPYCYGTEDEFFLSAETSPAFMIRPVEKLYSRFGGIKKFNIK